MEEGARHLPAAFAHEVRIKLRVAGIFIILRNSMRQSGAVMSWRAKAAIFGLFLVAVGCWGSLAFFGTPIAAWFNGDAEAGLAEAGQWGDTFGALNALFGSIGALAVVVTLIVQGIAISAQQRDQHLQRFDASFFELIRLLKEAREAIEFQPTNEHWRRGSNVSNELKRGLDAIRAAMREVIFWIADDGWSGGRDTYESIYHTSVHSRFESTLSPYFRLMYTILRRIDEDSVLSSKEKAQYGNLLRSQLTSFEIASAGFNGLLKSSNNFHEYVVSFHLLKYLPHQSLDNGDLRRALEQVYDKSAFQARD